MNDVDVARDDLALDALAAGVAPVGHDEVYGLLHALRTDLDPAADADDAATPPTVVPLRPRRRRLSLIALSAAAGLVLGGVTAGAVVTADQPGDLLYAARTAVLGDPRAAERVTKLLDEAAEALAEGDREEAGKRLDKAVERLADVEDPAARAALRERVDRLRALAALPAPAPTRGADETPEPRETSSPDDDGSESPEPRESEPDDNSGSGSSNSGSGSDDSGSDSSGKGSDDVLKTLDPDDSSGKGGDSDDA